MNKLNAFLIAFISVCLMSCSNLTDKGEQNIKDFKRKYSCYYINTGKGKSGSFIPSSKVKTEYFLSITIVGCSKDITFDNVENNEDIIREFAESIFFECEDKSQYDYINVEFKITEDGSNAKNFIYRLGSNNKLYLEHFTIDKPYSPF